MNSAKPNPGETPQADEAESRAKPRKKPTLARRIRVATRPARKRFLGFLIRAGSCVFGRAPDRLGLFAAAAIGRAAYYFDYADRRRALEHLSLAYGSEMPEAERRRTARQIFENLGRCAFEILKARRNRADPGWLGKRFVLSGHEAAQECGRQGQGFFIITCHMNNWELLGSAIARLVGTPPLVVAREQSNALVDQWLNETRARIGMRVHTRGADARAILKALRAGDGVAFLIDQDTKAAGDFVPFFGRPAYTFTGPALLAVRSKCPIFIVNSRRDPDGFTHHVTFRGPLYPSDTGDRDADVLEFTAKMTAMIEEDIRRAPGQWVWFHRRWRKQPEDQARD